ncbi:MAG: DegV family EDD domain-containing protein [Spirochaetales bacterium]|nr:DegV family EDD domain-containing protein [Spirochaetales bacterium]
MQIAYVDGRRLRRSLIAGAALVRESAAYLDSINVFPVTDGDTGSNMAATVGTMERGVRSSFLKHAGATLRAAADAALSGSRGNSGAIVAQFIHGLADEIRHEARVGVRTFARAVEAAVERTRKAVSNPREGTILTVLRDWSSSLREQAERSDDFFPVWKKALEAARRSLERTRELLPEARKAGVVDAGASGFVRYLEGVDAFLEGGKLRDLETTPSALSDDDLFSEPVPGDGLGEESTGLRFCVEALLEDACNALDADAIRAAITPLGDSVVIAGGAGRARVHVHSDDPPAIFSTLAAFGRLAAQKVDDMAVQRRLSASADRACVVVVDSTADLPDALREELLIPRIPVRLEVDGTEYLDRDAIRAADVAERMRADPSLPTKSSMPAHADYVRVLSQATSRGAEAVYLALSGAVSGTCAGGVRAAAELAGKGRAVRVVDTRSGAIGVALLARRCAEAATSGASADQVADLAEALRSRLEIRFAVGRLDRLVRSGRLSRVVGLALTGLGVRPLLRIDEAGRIAKAGLFLGPKRGRAALERELGRALSKAGGAVEDIAVTHVGMREEAERFAEALGARYRPARPVLVVDLSPAISGHVGPGTLAVAWIAAPAAGARS